MTTPPTENVVQVKASANVYTVLMIVAILALLVSIGFSASRLMGSNEAGYGMSAGDMFTPFSDLKKQVDSKSGK